jgi:hypothetical protein
MTKIKVAVVLTLFLTALGIWGCNKDKNSNPSVGFTTTSVNLNAQTNPNATVTVQLSKSVNQNVEIWMELLGPDTLQFGSLNSNFLNDDSNRILGALSVQAVIDTPINKYTAHVVVGYNTGSFTISLAALFDNFAKRGVTYKLKIYQVNNGTIKSGSDVLTINVASQAMIPVFTSSLYQVDPTYGTSLYTLNGYSFTPSTGNAYNFDLTYNETQGSSPNSTFNINFSNIVPDTTRSVYTSDDGFGKLYTHFRVSPTPSSTRGNYYIMNIDSGSIIWVNNGDTAKASLGCTFVNF